MRNLNTFYCRFTILLMGIFLFSSFQTNDKNNATFTLPYKQVGLSQRQAAAHLLSRFTYGPRSTDVDAVIKIGLEKWLLKQLEAKLPDDSVNNMLSKYDALQLSNAEVMNNYPKANQVLRMAIADGTIDVAARDKTDKSAYRSKLMAYMKQKGFKPQQELYSQFINQKILRAAYSNNQLQELLTDFWFNHFNVSLNKNQCAEFIPAYERDVIRPHVLGKFEDILIATAQSPAMLMYLDNFSSMGINEEMGKASGNQRQAARLQMQSPKADRQTEKIKKSKKIQGLNENYAREVMELHTLGVDGGYTQQDVTQAARVLTGWTIYPMSDKGYGSAAKQLLGGLDQNALKKRGFVHNGDFLFAANRHDTKEKKVLGKHFPAGVGYEEGVDLLKILAHHSSTAKFISRKIAIRFVSDNPPESLVNKMAKTFEKSGDIKQVLITMASAPEFWSKDALREKTKSPFELAISAVRSLNAEITQPYQLYTWIAKMGQRLYYYQAPTGFPDKAQYWINTGALLNRMNFGLALASQRISGVHINLSNLNHNREPESSAAALLTYSKIIMPERDLSETIKRLTPMLNDPTLVAKVEEAANKSVVTEKPAMMVNEDAIIMGNDQKAEKLNGKSYKAKAKGKNKYADMQSSIGNNSMLAQVVGVIIGSPEFQRK